MKNGRISAARSGCSNSLIRVARPASASPLLIDLSDRNSPMANSAQGAAAAPMRSSHFSTGVGIGRPAPEAKVPSAIEIGSGLRATLKAARRNVFSGPWPAATSSSISMTPNTMDTIEVTMTATMAGGRPASPKAARQSGTPM
jgi:hypothetical protein